VPHVPADTDRPHALQESIHQSQAWFMACVSHAPGMARMMAEHIRGCPDYARQLHTIYLANDILLKSCAVLDIILALSANQQRQLLAQVMTTTLTKADRDLSILSQQGRAAH